MNAAVLADPQKLAPISIVRALDTLQTTYEEK